ncbi:MAG: tetratricopeptide repeat protein [Verrucomicrobia bacterium]|nr:tetratricopeptide repeat protein [Verrucomicrobiota bacterium]
MKPISLPTYAKWAGRVFFALPLLLYILTLSTGFVPGQSASVVAAHLGVDPFPPLVNHVWGWVVRLLAAVPVGPLAVRIHLFGAICCSASIWLLFQIMVRLGLPAAFEKGMSPSRVARVRVFSATAACLALATAIPFWMVATRAHPLAFDLMLLLAAFHLLLRFGENGSARYLNSAVLLYGVGLTDFASLVLFLPIFGLLTLYQLARHRLLRMGVVLRLLGLALLGLAPQFIAAALYMKNPAYAWREFSHYGQVLYYMWRDQYLLVLRSLPRTGWITVGMVSVVPWVIVYVFRPTRRSESVSILSGAGLLALLLTALAVLVFTNTILSPWAMTHATPLLVTPYLLIAMWVGGIAGYWLTVLYQGRAAFWRVVRIAYRGAVLLALLSLVYFNAPEASGRPGRWFGSFAREVCDRLDGRDLLISSGAFDDVLLLEARARRIPLKIINLQVAQQLSYRRYIASLFPDNTRLQSLATVGIQPFLIEWFTTDTNIASRVAVLDASDLWMGAGLNSEPHGLLYLGRARGASDGVESLMGDNRTFWTNFAYPLAENMPHESNPMQVWLKSLAWQSAKAANNFGVQCEEASRPDFAEEAYLAAHRINAQNISALVNLHALYARSERPEAEAVEKDLDGLIERDQVQRALWSLSHYHGLIRSPELYASRGWAWAMSGKPALAAQDLQQALDLAGDSENRSLRLILAALDDQTAGTGGASTEEFLLAEQAKSPDNISAAYSLYQIAIRRGQFDEARSRLNELAKMKNAPQDALQTDAAILDLMTGNYGAAFNQLGEIVRKRPSDLRAWASLAIAAGQQKDEKTAREALARLQQAPRVSPMIRFLTVQLALRVGDRAGARQQLELLLRQEPRHVPALELLVRLLMAEGERETAERYVDQLVSADPGNALGNYMLGAMQALRGQYALAESSYRVSLIKSREPSTLNDLAYVLARRKQFPEALKLIEECLATTDLNGAASSTYGYILLQLKRYAEAEVELQKALALNPEAAEVQMNMAQLFEQTGRSAEALTLADPLLSRVSELLPDDQETLRELLKRLRRNR